MTFWFIAAALMLIAELFLGSVYLMVLSGALAGAGLVHYFSGSFSLALFYAAVLCGIGIFAVSRQLQKRAKPSGADDDLDIGQTVQILNALPGGRYEVLYRGAHWQAHALNGTPSETPQQAVIAGKQGNTLLIQLH